MLPMILLLVHPIALRERGAYLPSCISIKHKGYEC